VAEVPEPASVVFLDACCAINLLACGAAEEILRELPFDFSVTPRVLDEEVLYVREDGEGDADASDVSDGAVGQSGAESPDEGAREVRLQALVDSGVLTVADPLSEAEIETFVSLAFELDDGEAETAAAAIHRGAAIATDDRKAIRVLRAQASTVVIHRTSSMIKAWAQGASVTDERVREALGAIERLASFVPPRDDPDRDWWMKLLREGVD